MLDIDLKDKMNQTLALRKYISNDRNLVALASSSSSFSIDPLMPVGKSSVGLDYSGLFPAITSLKSPAPCSIQPGTTINFDAIKKGAAYPPACLELIPSTEWLRRYGLKSNRLNVESILGSIGFKKSQGLCVLYLN